MRGRVGMAQDLAASGVELPELMTADRWKNPLMPARYTERRWPDGESWPGIVPWRRGVNVTGSCRQHGFEGITVDHPVDGQGLAKMRSHSEKTRFDVTPRERRS